MISWAEMVWNTCVLPSIFKSQPAKFYLVIYLGVPVDEAKRDL